MTLTLTIPIRTKNPTNNREHWRVVSKRSKAQRAATFISLRGAMPIHDSRHGVYRDVPSWMQWEPLTVTLTRIAPSAGLDDDAIPPALKSIRDGIADAINGGNDRDARIRWEYAQRRGPWGVEVRIERRVTT